MYYEGFFNRYRTTQGTDRPIHIDLQAFYLKIEIPLNRFDKKFLGKLFQVECISQQLNQP